MTEEETLHIVFNKPEWRMADFPFGDNKEATIAAMSQHAKQESISFLIWAVKNHSVEFEGFSIPTWVNHEEHNPEQLYSLFKQQSKPKAQ